MNARQFAWLLLCLSVVTSAIAQERIDLPVDDLNDKYRLIGKLGKPLGTPMKVEGVAVERYTKQAGPFLMVLRIDGRAMQTALETVLRGEFGEKDGEATLPAIKVGETYELEGYEEGWYWSPIPAAAIEGRRPVGMPPSGFHTALSVYKGRTIAPIHFGPYEFVDRDGLLDGRATSESGKAYISRDGWRLLVDDRAPWPPHFEGKRVEGRGIVRATEAKDSYRLEKASTRLVKLDDQVGREVQLRGRAQREGDFWWFEYRETNIYVEAMEKLPGWGDNNDGRPMLIRGRLEKAKLPRIEDVARMPDPATEERFVVRKASWEPIDALLGLELLAIRE